MKGTRIISAAVALAALIGASAMTANPASAGGFRGHIYFGAPIYGPAYHDPYYSPRPYYGYRHCKIRYVRRWSPRRHRYVTLRKRICW